MKKILLQLCRRVFCLCFPLSFIASGLTFRSLIHFKFIFQKGVTCTKMFIAALFTTARTRKQPKCPPTDEWIKKMWHIYNGILLSHKKI